MTTLVLNSLLNFPGSLFFIFQIKVFSLFVRILHTTLIHSSYPMKKIFFFAFFQISFFTYSQTQLIVDYQEIDSVIRDSTSPNFYPKLLERWNDFDTTLSLREYAFIYYGFSFQANYLRNRPKEDKLLELHRLEKWDEVLEECKAILILNPVSLYANNEMAYALFQLNKEEAIWRKYQIRYRAIRKVIAYSGDGLSEETAFKVIYVSDEYNMLGTYFIIEEVGNQYLIGTCDKYDVSPGDYFNGTEIYFDISRKLIVESKMLEGK